MLCLKKLSTILLKKIGNIKIMSKFEDLTSYPLPRRLRRDLTKNQNIPSFPLLVKQA